LNGVVSTGIPPLDDRAADLLRLLHADLGAAGFTVAELDDLWGTDAAAALHRGERVPARRVLDARRAAHGVSDPLATLAELFLLAHPADRVSADNALPTLGVAGAAELGLVSVEASSDAGGAACVRALLDLRPYAFSDALGDGHWWILSDLGELALGHALGEQHVLGVGGASMTLSGLMLPTIARRVLDLGTGCGIQAMHAARFADEVVATDISERALGIAALNLALNGVDGVELRLGSLFEPVAGERFDRIVSNPPFVITPRATGVPEYDYRDGGMTGDGVVEAVMRGAADHLEPGGVAQLLGNSETRDGADGLDRVRAWAGSLEHWIVEREVQQVTEYAETWVRDGGTRSGTAEFDRLYDAWLDDFVERGVTEVGFGYLVLRRPATDAAPRLRRTERADAPLDGVTGLGAHLSGALAAHDVVAALDDAALRATRLRVAGDVTEERSYWPGAEDPSVIVLRQGGGLRRELRADPALAAVVGACDGELPLGVITDAVAELLGIDAARMGPALLAEVRELVIDGILQPAP
jgi:methylase of polypeptide subunit release factors